MSARAKLHTALPDMELSGVVNTATLDTAPRETWAASTILVSGKILIEKILLLGKNISPKFIVRKIYLSMQMKCQEKSSSKRYLLSPSGLRAWIWLKWKGLRPGTEQFSRAFTKLVHLVRESPQLL